MGTLLHGVTHCSCQGVNVSEGGMLIKVVHRLFARGGCGLLVVQTFDVSARLVLYSTARLCCNCRRIAWIATRLVGLYDIMILWSKFSRICLRPPLVSDPVH